MGKYLYEDYLSTFIYRDIGKKLNMSFDEFINRPKYELEMMITTIIEIDKKRMANDESMLKELSNKPASGN